jgi:hypothetical protein
MNSRCKTFAKLTGLRRAASASQVEAVSKQAEYRLVRMCWGAGIR